MKFTPTYGWPIADDTDVVKQYPTTVDEPFKMALDTSVANAGRRFGSTCTGIYNASPPQGQLVVIPLSNIYNFEDGGSGTLVAGQPYFLPSYVGYYMVTVEYQFSYAAPDSEVHLIAYPAIHFDGPALGVNINAVHYPEPRIGGQIATGAAQHNWTASSPILGPYGAPVSLSASVTFEYIGDNPA